MVAIEPFDAWPKARVGRPAMRAARFRASACASATANCAVGGARRRARAVGAGRAVADQRAIADRPGAGAAGHREVGGGDDAAALRAATPSCATSGFGFVPIVQTTVALSSDVAAVEDDAVGVDARRARLQANVDAALRAASQRGARRATPAVSGSSRSPPSSTVTRSSSRPTRG